MTTPVTNVVTLENFRDNFFPGSPGTSAISSYGSSSFKIGDAQKSVQKNQGGDCRPGQPPLWSRNCLMLQSHPEKHGSTGLEPWGNTRVNLPFPQLVS